MPAREALQAVMSDQSQIRTRSHRPQVERVVQTHCWAELAGQTLLCLRACFRMDCCQLAHRRMQSSSLVDLWLGRMDYSAAAVLGAALHFQTRNSGLQRQKTRFAARLHLQKGSAVAVVAAAHRRMVETAGRKLALPPVQNRLTQKSAGSAARQKEMVCSHLGKTPAQRRFLRHRGSRVRRMTSHSQAAAQTVKVFHQAQTVDRSRRHHLLHLADSAVRKLNRRHYHHLADSAVRTLSRRRYRRLAAKAGRMMILFHHQSLMAETQTLSWDQLGVSVAQNHFAVSGKAGCSSRRDRVCSGADARPR